MPVERIGFEDPLRGVLHLPAVATTEAACIVIAHGFKGFMGWGMFPWIADRLAAAGFAAVRFDFSHNGADADGNFTRLDLFRENTLSKEQEDLDRLLSAIGQGREPFGGRCRPSGFGLLGHSRGGGGVLLCAARAPGVAAVATIAAVARANRFAPEAREQAERQGYFEVLNARTGQQMPVGLAYFRDAERHDIPGAVRSLTQPLLIVHGTADESVPVEDGRTLAKAATGEVRLVEIEGGGHTLGAVHPFAGPTPHLEQAMGEIVPFFHEHLGRAHTA